MSLADLPAGRCFLVGPLSALAEVLLSRDLVHRETVFILEASNSFFIELNARGSFIIIVIYVCVGLRVDVLAFDFDLG